MGLEVRRRSGVIEAETETLRVVVDPALGSLAIHSERAGVHLAGLRPRAVVGGRTLEAERCRSDGFEKVTDASGTRAQISLVLPLPGALALHVRLALEAGATGVELDVALESAAADPVPVEALDLAAWTPGAGELRLPPAPRFLRLGYQSWSPAGWLRLDARERPPRAGLPRRMLWGPYTPTPGRDRRVSDFATALGAPGGPALGLGFLTHRRFLTHVALEASRGVPRSLHARVSCEGRPLAPRERLQGERLWIGLEPAGSDPLAAWAARAGRAMGARAASVPPTGWCSWYRHFHRVTAADVRRNVRALSRANPGLATLQIDDGAFAARGDWLEPSAGFPEGLAPLAREIRGAGLVPGLWIAPFLVSQTSRTAGAHPDWLLRRPDGEPWVAARSRRWKDRRCLALDPTHPEARAWLAEVVRTFRGQGFGMWKLDYLFAGALPGRRHAPACASAEAYRLGLSALREAAEAPAEILGCGAPLGPSIGIVDTLRISPDVAPAWRAPLRDLVLGSAAAPATRNALRNVLVRAPLQGRLFDVDPDCVLLRERATRLRPPEVESLVAAVALCGGRVTSSDDLDELSRARARWLERLLPPTGLAAVPAPLAGDFPGGLDRRFPDGSVLVWRVNLGRRARPLEIDPVSLGLPPRVRAFDVLRERVLGVLEAPLRLPPLAPRHSVLLRLTPADGGPTVVGSSLHVSAGALETASLEERNGYVRVQLRVPTPRSGRVWVAGARGGVVPFHVEVEGEAELWVDPGSAGVEETPGIHDP